jgi:glycosyltransferase involved in cell wall biosynthesis
MKVVHLNTFDISGAGIAAYRLHSGLLAAGVRSSFLSFGINEPEKKKFDYYASLNFPQRLYFKFIDNYSSRKKTADEFNRKIRAIKNDVEIYTSPFTKFHVEDHPLVKEADIVHLHWLPGFVNIPSFFEKINKPIVWTLHDMNPFMGGFHYLDDSVRNSSAFKEVEERSVKIKQEAIRSFSKKLFVVCPSSWLANEAKKSSILSGKDIQVIPNGIEVKGISKVDKLKFKSEFEMQANKKALIFLADNVTNKRKGYDLLLSALQKLEVENIHLITVGRSGELPEVKAAIKHMGPIYDSDKLFRLIAASDALIVPSREDNLPNVMLEAFVCGTPVIAFPVGGLAEHIKKENGLLAKDLSAASLANVLADFISSENVYDAEAIVAYAKDNFLISTITDKYIRVYRNIIN